MNPTVFVSSTVRDLQHLRDTVRDTLTDLGYSPIMSEYGEIGYLPNLNAADSCYSAMGASQLAILIIGKRYSEPAENGASVTENEYRTAVKNNIPIITLVDREVMAFKRVFDANVSRRKNGIYKYPGMDRPDKTFAFIDAITASRFNNGVLEYAHATEARKVIKQQFAHLFASLLSREFDPVQAEIKDVLAEIKTLRREVGKKSQSGSRAYMALYRFVLDNSNKMVRGLIKELNRQLDDIVSPLMKSASWADFMKKIRVEVGYTEDEEIYRLDKPMQVKHIAHSFSHYARVEDGVICKWAVDHAGKLWLNKAAAADLDLFVKKARSVASGAAVEW